MAMRELVEGDCGTANPLMKTVSHFVQDQAYRKQNRGFVSAQESETDELVREFLSEQYATTEMAPHTFHMDSLLQEMREIDNTCNPPVIGLQVADIACVENWPDEFMKVKEDGSECDKTGMENWADEFLQAKEGCFGDSGWANEFSLNTVGESIPSNKWAAEYLEMPGEQKNTEARDMLDDTKWIEDFKQEEDLDLAKTANELLGTVDDPKFSNSNFMKFIKKLADGESKVEGNKVLSVAGSEREANAWASTYSSQSADGVWIQDYQDSSRTVTNTSSTTSEIITSTENSFWESIQNME